ncbi:L,D-transpeptidase [Sinorhizobium sp. BG8]|uniref:L,D-transpeptidase n=1 Tax=Sinorhizobium sp. BG8 TaxID=2613773 RepID=UPI00193EAEC2|nr:L,D-transpeptidase [Sinorhizobium sp. BG8]QRM57206.1 L,D-transpeptidase [Sinorhizobium sp. BG8]
MDKSFMTRRAFSLVSLMLSVSGCSSTYWSIPYISNYRVATQYRRRRVPYAGGEEPGTIVVNTAERYLYHVEGGGRATRYGVAVGEAGLSLKGEATVGRKAEWPSWTPTANMIERKPRLQQYAGGVEGGLHNPLGAAALYLYRGDHDTMFRLHGTNEPWSIGHAVSNGCIRLTNKDIVHLYNRTPIGTKVLVI